MNKPYDLHIVAVVEEGYLEEQLKLLVLSVSEFLYPNVKVKIIACSPRKGKSPGKKFQSFLSSNNVEFIDKPLNIDHEYFPLCNGIYACDYVVNNFPDISSLLLVDTDTLFLNEIDKEILNKNNVHIRPVGFKGIGVSNENDENYKYWSEAFALFNLKLPKRFIKSTVDQQLIVPYYNSGFVLSNDPSFFNMWKNDFERIMDSNVRTDPNSSRHLVEYGFNEQMSLSVTTEKFKCPAKILPETYNYHIPFRPKMKNRMNHPRFNEIIHIHYHKWFQHPDFLDHVTSDADKFTKQYLWLREYLPLYPIMKRPFKC